MAETLTVQLMVDGRPVEDPETLVVENIPGGWRLQREHPQPEEDPGMGVSRYEAVADWVGKNLSGRRVRADSVPGMVMQTLLNRASSPELRRLGHQLFNGLLGQQIEED